MYLYGSHARGAGDIESDVDVLIVLENVDDHWEEIQLVFPHAALTS